MQLIGFDLGSSSVKVSVIDTDTGNLIASAFAPQKEMDIHAPHAGWAEQDPEKWWHFLQLACKEVLNHEKVDAARIKAIGISYQMHGLVVVDKNGKVLRPSIIWCDSRAVNIGDTAFEEIGSKKCLKHLLNSPGNFTASKLKWVKEHQPEVYDRIHKILLPGDYLAYRLTGELNSTTSGLSEGIFWDFKEDAIAGFLMEHYGFDPALVPDVVPTFSPQGYLSKNAANELGLPSGIPVTYRAGDQPNNALSLNVLQPGEVAATAGTSGVIYGVNELRNYDPQSRVNIFAHVNHTPELKRLGVLLCVNGTGILYNWLRQTLQIDDYVRMNTLAEKVPVGSEGVTILPFGNGAERLLNNKDIGCHINGLNFNVHSQGHLIRAAKEGIVFSLNYGLDIMREMGVSSNVIRAGQANMFQSEIFRETLANISGAVIELYNTDGAQGAARAAGIGAGIYHNFEEAFSGLKKLKVIEPDNSKKQLYEEAYGGWKENLRNTLKC